MGAGFEHRLGRYGGAGMREWRASVTRMQAELAGLYGRDVDAATLDVLSDLYDLYLGDSNQRLDSSTRLGGIDPMSSIRSITH
ncbi:MAG: hypothetical protein O7F73_07940 [Gammaproteobacteria bacterium]|nr:hypothetical protein [Gammaproteobacteria bacterium]